jgi:hypothetical protein
MIAVINKMMAKDPGQRYQTPLEVVEALARWTQQPIPPPAENEMPRLSLAARGRIRGDATSSPATPTLSGPLSSSRTRKTWQVPEGQTPQPNVGSLPVPSAPATTPAAATLGTTPAKAQTTPAPIVPAELGLAEPLENEVSGQPAPALPIEKEDSVPWIELAADTENHIAKANTDPLPPKKPVVRQPRPRKALAHAKHKGRPWWWVGGIGGGMLVALIGILVWRVSPGRVHKEAESPTTRPPLLVSRSGQDNAFRTLHDALRSAQDGDHIVVAEDIDEQLELLQSKKNLVIEAKPGKPIVWRAARTEPSIVFLNGVGNLRIRGFTFDGRDLVDQILLITGHSPGLTLEDIQLRGFRKYGIVVANASGKKHEPVAFIRVQAPTRTPKEAAIAFAADPKLSPKTNEHFVIKESRFDGPYVTAVRLSDPSVVRDVVFSQNTPSSLNQTAK